MYMQGQILAYSVIYSQIFYIRHGHSTDLIHPVSLITACVSGGSAMCGCVESVWRDGKCVGVLRQYVEGWEM